MPLTTRRRPLTVDRDLIDRPPRNRNLEQEAPDRSLSWRWDRLEALVEASSGWSDHHCRPAGTDDGCVRAVFSFARAAVLQADEDPRIKRDLHHADPGLYTAVRAHRGSDTDPETVSLLQALLLAGEPFEAIETAMAMPAWTARWYEKLFFNVRDRLDCVGWIAGRVLAPALRATLDARTRARGDAARHPTPVLAIVGDPVFDATLKIFGYYGGADAVFHMLTGLQAGRRPTSPRDVKTWLQEATISQFNRRAFVASAVAPVSGHNLAEIFQVQARLMELTADHQDDASALQARLKDYLEGWPLELSSPSDTPPRVLDGPRTQSLRQTAKIEVIDRLPAPETHVETAHA